MVINCALDIIIVFLFYIYISLVVDSILGSLNCKRILMYIKFLLLL